MQAIPSVWLLTDKQTGSPSYLHFHEGEEVWTVGPFVYTKESDAQAAAQTYSFMKGVTSEIDGEKPDLACAEIEGMGFVKGILTRFDPSGSDVFALNEGLLPLTTNGANWVDNLTQRNDWRPLFQPASEFSGWLSAILRQVSEQLGVEMIQLTLDKQEVIQARAVAARRKIEENVRITVDPEGPALFGEVPKGTLFRVRTHGMRELGRSELEMAGIQPLFVGDAMALLAGWASYSLDHPVEVGTSLMGSVDPVTVILGVEASDKPGIIRLVVEQVVYTNPAQSRSGLLH